MTGLKPTQETWLPKPMQTEATRLIAVHDEIMRQLHEVKAMEQATIAANKPAGTTDQTQYYSKQATLWKAQAEYCDSLSAWRQAYGVVLSKEVQQAQAELRDVEAELWSVFPKTCHPREVLIISPLWQTQRAITEELEGRDQRRFYQHHATGAGSNHRSA